jgi:hypothetical protein
VQFGKGEKGKRRYEKEKMREVNRKREKGRKKGIRDIRLQMWSVLVQCKQVRAAIIRVQTAVGSAVLKRDISV